jgi:ADP-dependent NAD(P)H-hydrate dehydratase / NAD(P)H-hydrate epimerase
LQLFRTPELREIEKTYGWVEPPLMERAGSAAAEKARTMLADDGPVLVLAGPGNNGGDAFVAARHLRLWGYAVVVLFQGGAEKLPPDARVAHDRWLASGGAVSTGWPESDRFGLIVDGVFGTGLTRDPGGIYAEWITRANASGTPILALDAPSGLDADTGRAHAPTIRAARTVTFIALKPGLFTLDGPDHCGKVEMEDLGIRALPDSPGRLLTPATVRGLLRPRARDSHKGSFGSLGIVGGAPGMIGAAILAGRTALALGAGRVTLGCLGEIALDAGQPQLMFQQPENIPGTTHLTALLAGPGLGSSERALGILNALIALPLPLVLDADALNLLSENSDLSTGLVKRPAPTVLTPHPAEAGRLLGRSTASVQDDRIETALRLAQAFGAEVVLKGNGSVCASPDGFWWINASGNPALASAGMGDVLAGMIGAMLAQGLSAREALLLGVHLHGLAADELAAPRIGPLGVTAGEITDQARRILNRWVYGPKDVSTEAAG